MKSELVKVDSQKDQLVNSLASIDVDTNPVRYTRLGWIIVLVGVLGFLIWAMLAPLDKGVPMSGSVTVASNRKLVQHQIGGTIDEILVKDGDVVKAGQVLLRMNSVASKSAAEVTRIQLYTAMATEARLAAERDLRKSVVFPPELEKAKADSRVANVMQLQQQLFMTRQSSLQSELGALEENIVGMKSQLHGLQEAMISKKQQLQFLREQLDGMRDLAKDGYVAKNRLLDLERTYAQVNGAISEDLGNIGRVQRQITEVSLRRAQRTQDYQKEVRTQLTDIQRETEALQNRLQAQDFELANVEVKAPVDGTVVNLAVFTKGGVVPGGFKLMELVPGDDPLIVEGNLPVNLVDKVHTGLPVELIFAAFNSNTTPHIPGELTQISADRIVDEKSGMAFYRVKASVTPEGKKLLKDLKVVPGMPVELFVKTGERTLMNYLLKPVMDRAKTALSED